MTPPPLDADHSGRELGWLSWLSGAAGLSAMCLGYLAWQLDHVALLGLSLVTLVLAGHAFRRLHSLRAQLSLREPAPVADEPAKSAGVIVESVEVPESSGTFAPSERGQRVPQASSTQPIAGRSHEAESQEASAGEAPQQEDANQHVQRLEVVGRLAGGIAHDFNNTLTVILSYGELLKARLGVGHPLAELADHIVQAAEHGGVLTKQLLTFTRRQVSKPRPVDVRELLRSTERAVARVIPRSIVVHHNDAQEELFVRIDALQLQQAVLNLVLNARDAMPRGGELHLEVAPAEVEAENAVGLIPGAYVVVRVRDSGTGIAPGVLPHMFEPFFTTKAPGRGTGLGLSNVREITEAAGGRVSVRSELGKGSVFALYFPRVDARPSGVLSRLPAARDHRASILVVDDDHQIREVIRTMLSEGGYLVKTAHTGREALELLATESIDLVCTDLMMPDMTGAGLIDALRTQSPHMPVVLCSAYGSDLELGRRVARGEAWFLGKPFTRQELLDVVERALTKSRKPSGAGATSSIEQSPQKR